MPGCGHRILRILMPVGSHALYPCLSTRSCQIPIALRPRDNSSSIISRYASLAPERRLTCSGTVASGKKPVITSLAGFELSEPVVTDVVAFDGALRPQPPGMRSATPADLR